jgi:hypothetical protein
MVRRNPKKFLKKEYNGSFFDATPGGLKRELYAKL